MRRLAGFRRHPLWWSVPLAVVAANVVWLSAFGSGARLRSAALDRELERVRAAHREATTRLAERERLWVAATENRERIERFYSERLSTERERLTAVTREVKQLAARAGLEPRTIAYPEESYEEYGLLRRSFAFSVGGTYAGLRTFLHLLELSPSFVVVDQIGVRESSGGELAIGLRLSTLFAAPGPAAADGAAEAAAGAAAPAVPVSPAADAGTAADGAPTPRGLAR